MIDRGNRVLPQQVLLGNKGAQVSRDRSHVAVRQLKPGPRERIGELLRRARRSALKFFRKQGRSAKKRSVVSMDGRATL